jgi:hypothetical protein
VFFFHVTVALVSKVFSFTEISGVASFIAVFTLFSNSHPYNNSMRMKDMFRPTPMELFL